VSISATNSLSGFTAGPGTGIGPRSRVITLRPIGEPTPSAPAERTNAVQRTQPARTGTAYQTNADGDSVTLGSKLDQLSDEEKQEVTKLKARDSEVRTHEQAHVSAAGSLFRGGPYYDFKTGPDGQEYAVAGRVNIDTSEGRTPEETLQRAQQIRRAALAPAEPSTTDQRVAAKAASMESKARQELAQARAEGWARRERGDTHRAGNAEVGAADRTPRREPTAPGVSAGAAAAGIGELKIDLYG
jgi:hypothetical protein